MTGYNLVDSWMETERARKLALAAKAWNELADLDDEQDQYAAELIELVGFNKAQDMLGDAATEVKLWW